eukprot:g8697.t1
MRLRRTNEMARYYHSTFQAPLKSQFGRLDKRSRIQRMMKFAVKGSRAQYVVCCGIADEGEDLWKKTNKELIQMLKKKKISGYSGKPKKMLIEMLTKHEQDKETAKEEIVEDMNKSYDEILFTEIQEEEEKDVDDIANITYSNRSELESKLCGFTVAELRKALKERGAPATGRKMDVVAHLASLLEEEKLRFTFVPGSDEKVSFSSDESITEDKEETSVHSSWLILDKKGMTKNVNYSKFLDIDQFAQCVKLEADLRRKQDMKESKEELNIILKSSVRALEPKNIKLDTLKSYLTALDIYYEDDWSCEDIIEQLGDIEDILPDLSNAESEKSSGRIIQVMKEWLSEIEKTVIAESPLADSEKWTDEYIQSKLLESNFNISSKREINEAMVKHQIMAETNLLNRVLSILALQMLYRSQTLKNSELAFIFNLNQLKTNQVMKSEELTELLQLAFLRASIPMFFQLFNTRLEEEQKSIEELRAYAQGDSTMSLQTRKRLEEDPTVNFGVIFGGNVDPSTMADNISSVRCLLDHLQTAPYAPSDPNDSENASKEEKGFKLFLYYLGSTSSEVFKLTSDEFLSLDISDFEFWPKKNHHKGELISSFGEFLNDLQTYDCIVPLTSSLDVYACQNKSYEKILRELDPFFYGSSLPARLLTQNMFGCLTYLKSRKFTTPILYRIKHEDLTDLETWSDGFKRFCKFHHIEEEKQEFQITPCSAHSHEKHTHCSGLSGIVATASSILDKEKDGNEAIIQPCIHKDRFIDFSCVVLETRTQPVALVPTEIEYIEPEYVRSMSSGLRRHTPPRFTIEIIQAMREHAIKVFEELDLSGYACIHGRVMMDVPKEHEKNNKELPLPRPLPIVPGCGEPDPLPEEFLNHMEGLLEEKDEELKKMVTAYESSDYSVEGLRYMKALDVRDAKRGINSNHYQAIEEDIRAARTHLKEIKEAGDVKFKRIRQLEKEVLEETKQTLGDQWIETEPQPELEKSKEPRDDFSVVITGVDTNITMATDSILFQQAAASGMSHATVLRHLLDIGLPSDYKLMPVENEPKTSNPLFPEYNNSSEVDDKHSSETPYSEELKPMQVWILCGGDGTGHQSSLSAGLNALMKLKRTNYIKPHLFVLDPARRTSASPDVLKGLYERRNDLMNRGISEDCLPEECRMEYLKCPRTTSFDLMWNPVWCLNYAHSLSRTLDEAIEESDRTRMIEQTAVCSRKDFMKDFRTIQLICQKELTQAGVSGVSSIWGGDSEELGPPPRMMTLEHFVIEAKEVGAMVFIAANGEVAQSGALQDLLDTHNVQYTGSGLTATKLCGSKEEIATYLADLGETKILYHRFISKEELIECGEDLEKAEEIFEETTAFLGSRDVCVKPLRDSFGGGIARLCTSADLQVYGNALVKNWEVIDGALLQQPHCAVPMSKPVSESYIIQPYVSPARFVKSIDGEITLAKASQIVELTFGLVGDLGQMIVLSPSLVLSNLETNDAFEGKYLKGMKNFVTPVPSKIVPADVIESAQRTIEKVADALALRGIARVDAFLDVRTKELTIIEVEPVPYLGEHSVIFQQAMLEDPPMYPEEIFEQIIQVALNYTSEVVEAKEESTDETEEQPEEDMMVNPWDDSKFWDAVIDDERPKGSFVEGQETLSNLWGNAKEEEDDEKKVDETSISSSD